MFRDGRFLTRRKNQRRVRRVDETTIGAADGDLGSINASRNYTHCSRNTHCCEYCQLPQQAVPFFTFHIEHITARQHGGDDDPSNLALACPDRNAHKGPNLTSIDPNTGQLVSLFGPRLHLWNEHFQLQGPRIFGRTPIGRATVRLLAMNDEDRLDMRRELQELGDM